MATDHQQQSEADAFLANDLIRFLREHDRGRLVEQLEDDLHKLVQAVKEHGKKGSVKLTLTISPADDDVEQVQVAVDTGLTLPRPGSPKRTYFPTAAGGLSRHHPNQLSLLD